VSRVSFHLSQVRGRYSVVISAYEPTIITVRDIYSYKLRSDCRSVKVKGKVIPLQARCGPEGG